MTLKKRDEKIYQLYETITHKELLSEEYAVIFVYNDEELINDNEHSSECITSIEKDMIVGSFQKSVQYVYAINSEDSFINKYPALKERHKNIFVYSMAQNINGIGRRSLIPLLCDYYKLNNIGSDFFSSTLGGHKELMYTLITPYAYNNIPFTIYVDRFTNLHELIKKLEDGIYILKPNDESASIGVEKLEISPENHIGIVEQLSNYQKKYTRFCIQEYIDGPEIEVPLLFYDQGYYCPGCVEIINSSPFGYLDYDTVKMDEYSFTEYSGNLYNQIIDCSKKVAIALNFKTICRIDFRIKNNIPYIIDIGANPTISMHSSTNYIFRKRFGDESAVYRLLFFMGLLKTKLFEPPFDKSE